MTPLRLFVLPVDVLNLRATFEPGLGWRLTVASWATGDRLEDHDVEHYERLSTAELLDVICMDASRRLTGC